MQELGRLLQEARQKRGLTLDDVHSRTKVNMHYLAAMEAGEFGELPGHVYCRAFLRLYAREVGLDIGEVLALYDAALMPSKAVETPAKEQPDSPPQRAEITRHFWRWAIVLVLLLTVLLARWLATPGRKQSNPPPVSDGPISPTPPLDTSEQIPEPNLQPFIEPRVPDDAEIEETPELPSPQISSEETETLYSGREPMEWSWGD